MTRLFLKISGLLILTNLLVMLGAYFLVQWLEKEELIISPRQAPQILADRVMKEYQQGTLEAYAKSLRDHGTSVALVDENRTVLFSMPALRRYLSSQRRPFVLGGERWGRAENKTRTDDDAKRPKRIGSQYTREVITDDNKIYYVLIRSVHKDHSLIPQAPWKRLYAPIAAFVLALLLGSSLISLFITSPIRSLRRTTQSFGLKDLSARVDTSVADRNDAIGELGRDFNRMASRLDDTLKSQHQLLRDVSHELRSPLARIQIASTLAEQKTGSSSELQRIDQETQRLDGLIEIILRLTRLNNTPELSLEPLELDELIDDVAQDARYEYQNTNKQVVVNLGALPTIQADYDNLRSALENIVRNAMYYTEDGSAVTISANASASGLVIIVRDHGPGVPEAHLKRLFEPFFRSDSSRNEKTGSNGVGLAITHRIIELHGGKVWAKNAANGGLVVTVELPTSLIT